MSAKVIMGGSVELDLDTLSTEELEQLSEAVDEVLADRNDAQEPETILPQLITNWYVVHDRWTREMYQEFMEEEFPEYARYADRIYDLLRYVEVDITIDPEEDHVYISRVYGMNP